MSDINYKGRSIDPTWFDAQSEESFVQFAVEQKWYSEEEAGEAFTELSYQARMKGLEDVPAFEVINDTPLDKEAVAITGSGSIQMNETQPKKKIKSTGTIKPNETSKISIK